MYKHKDDEEYVTTTIRVRKEDLENLRAIAKEDRRSLNYMVNKLIIDYLNLKLDLFKYE